MSSAPTLAELWRELSRRRVVRALAAYAAAAFIVLQAAQLILSALPGAAWVYTWLVVAALVGVPVVAVLAWLFELSGGRLVPDHRPGISGAAALRRGGAVAVLAATVMAGGWIVYGQGARDAQLDPELVAIFPFRVSAAGAGLAELPEGMVDLFEIQLQGESGTRAVDPRRTLNAWRDAGGGERDLLPEELQDLARELGAGRVLTGGLVATGDYVTVSASLFPVGIGKRVDASHEGSIDSLSWVVQRVARALLMRDAGEYEDRLALLASTSTPALRRYLQGQAAYRRARFGDARDAFSAALALDSTFALAALGLLEARVWAGGNITAAQARRAESVAWRGREHFSAVDREILHAVAGENWPEPNTVKESCAVWQRVAALVPDRPDPLYQVADCLYHYGPVFGESDFITRARGLFRRGLVLDSTFMPNIEHLLEIAAILRDTADFDRLAPLGSDTLRERAFLQRWFAAYVRRDSLAQRTLAKELRRQHPASLVGIYHHHMASQVDVQWADTIMRLGQDSALADGNRGVSAGQAMRRAMLQGRQRDAARAIGELAPAGDLNAPIVGVVAALYSELDTTLALPFLAELDRALPDSAAMRRHRGAACYREQWRAWRGDLRTTGAVIDLLEHPDSFVRTPIYAGNLRLCAKILRALQARATNAPDLRAHALRMDSIAAEYPEKLAHVGYIHLLAARLLEEAGDLEGALKALDRRDFASTWHRWTEATLRERGRIAERLGERERAIREYERYLAWRFNEDEYGQRASRPVRVALARLKGEGAPRR